MPPSLDNETTFRRRLRLRLHHQLRRLTLWPLAVVFALTLALLFLVGYLLTSAQRVDHTHEVAAQLAHVEMLALETETGIRGYRITGDISFLEPFEHGSAAMAAALDDLEALLRDDPSQTAELQRLRESLRAWSEAAATMRQRVSTGLPTDPALQLRGKTLMDGVRAQVDAMQERERGLLRERSRERERIRMFTFVGVALSGALFAPLLVFSIRRTLGHLDTSYRAAWDESDRERARLDITLSSIGDAVISTDPLGVVVYLNPVAAALTGWSMEEARGKTLETVFNIINETTRNVVESPVVGVLRAGGIVSLANHTLLLARDGREIPIADSAAPIRDPEGQIIGAVMVFRDQTDEREASRRLRESEARKAAILNSSLDAILGMDAAGLIVEFNPAAETIFGHRAADVIGRPLADVIIPAPLRAAHNRGLAHYLATREGPVLSKRIEMPALRADGTEFPAELSIHRIAGIEPPRFSGFIRDITERKRAEEALRASEERYRAMFAGSPMAVFVCDRHAVIQHYNQRAAELWGREPACGVEKHCGSVKLWLPDGTLLPHEQSPMMEVLRTGLPAHNVEVFIERPDGSRLPVLVNFAALRDAQGDITGAITSFTDITGRKKAEEEMAEKTRLLDLTTDAIMVRDVAGKIAYWNTGAEKLYGWSREEALGKVSHELLKTEFTTPLEEITAELYRENHWTGEFVHTTRDGRRITVLVRKVLDRDILGNPASILQTLTDITERKQAEEQLSRLAAIIESSDDAILSKDLRGFITSWNGGAERLYGYTVQEAVGQPVTMLIPPGRFDDETHILEQIRRGERVEHYETVRRRKDGTLIDVSLTVSPITNSKGEIIGASKIARDITERRRAEAELVESNRRFRGTFENAAVGIAHVAPDGRWLRINERICAITGYEHDELLGKTFQDITHPDDLNADVAQVERLLAGQGDSYTMEKRYLRKDGSAVWVNLTVSCERDGEGAVQYFIAVVEDISERKHAEEAVRAAGERFRFMAESMPQKIFTAQPDGAIDYFNQQWLEFTGMTAEQLKESGWRSFIHPEDLEENVRRWQHCLETGEYFELEHRFRRHDGVYRWHLSRAHAMRDADGKITMWIGSNTDIDDMMRAQEELMDAEKQLADRAVQLETLVSERTAKLSTAYAQLVVEADERKRLEAEVADAVEGERERLGQELHDGLVQELTGIGMMLHVLERQMTKPSPEFAAEAGRLCLMTEKAQENARNLAKSFYPVELEQHGLFVALESIAQRIREQFGISCVVQADEHSATRLHGASAVQLFRIAQEAVQNAAKHAQARNIIIRLGRQGDEWQLSIEDDGVGLPGGAQPTGGMGLRIMQYRARIIRGALTVRNNENGGVLVSCSAPAAQLESSGTEEKA